MGLPNRLRDKDALLSLVASAQMFSEEEQLVIADTFVPLDHQTLWFGSYLEDKMIGVAYCYPMEMTNRTWNVLMLLVHPDFHRQGIGRDLMVLTEKTLSERQERLLLVETSSTDAFDGARSFYQALGYDQQGLIHNYYDDNDHKVTFTKRLS